MKYDRIPVNVHGDPRDLAEAVRGLLAGPVIDHTEVRPRQGLGLPLLA